MEGFSSSYAGETRRAVRYIYLIHALVTTLLRVGFIYQTTVDHIAHILGSQNDIS